MPRDNLLQLMCRIEEAVFLKPELQWFLVARKTSAQHSAQTSLFPAAGRALQSALFNSSFLLLTCGDNVRRFRNHELVAFGIRLDRFLNRGLDFAKYFRRLPRKKSGGANAGV